jgi:hypothetical protein
MNKINWTAVGISSIVVLMVILVGVSLLGGWGYGGWGMMGPRMMGGWGFAPFGWIGMIFMWLIPIGLVVLAVFGIAWFVRSISGAGGPISPTRTCPNCGRTAQADWRTCPFCGQGLP